MGTGAWAQVHVYRVLWSGEPQEHTGHNPLFPSAVSLDTAWPPVGPRSEGVQVDTEAGQGLGWAGLG